MHLLAAAPRAKVVVLSGLGGSDLVEAATHRGAVAYLRKGSDPTMLPDLVRHYVEAS